MLAGVLGYVLFPWLEAKLDECAAARKAAREAEAAAKPKLVSKSALREQFEAFDKNGDGHIDFEEFTEFVEAHPSGVMLAKNGPASKKNVKRR